VIVAEIRRSGLVVADFTGNRGGVYFEAGFAMGLGIPVIWTCRDTDINAVHFDTRQYNHIVWKEAGDLREQLQRRIEATIPGRAIRRG
jgi:nucleoside 2-deoxyribosyltransferase